tara:strand:+ start:394 stop:585 length:192 start_codon:yes stop_codon:yes gene_type:complete
MTDKEKVINTLEEMLNHYSKNVGKPSKYTGYIITHKMIKGLTRRYLELGGKLVFETNDTNSQD